MDWWELMLMDMAFKDNKKNKKKNNNPFNFEEQCENCEDLLEDCECDHSDISDEDIGIPYDEDFDDF